MDVSTPILQHWWSGVENTLSAQSSPYNSHRKKQLSPNFKPLKEKVFMFNACFCVYVLLFCCRIVIPVNSGCYLESPVSAEGIWSLFPRVVPRSGQTHCCSVIIPLLLLQDTSLTFSNLHTLHLHMALPDVVIAAALACSPPFPVCF